MKFKEEFKNIEKPAEIDPSELEKFKKTIYGEGEQDTEKLVDKLISICEGYDFKDSKDIFNKLRIQFKPTFDPDSLRIVDNLRETTEALCYKLDKLKEKNPPLSASFKDLVGRSYLGACTEGALSNMQGILNEVDPSYYEQKFNFLNNVALGYLSENKITNTWSQGMEVHVVSVLLNQVASEYNLQVPPDKEEYIKSSQAIIDGANNRGPIVPFPEYLESFMSSSKSVHSFLDYVTTLKESDLPSNGGYKLIFEAPKTGNIENGKFHLYEDNGAVKYAVKNPDSKKEDIIHTISRNDFAQEINDNFDIKRERISKNRPLVDNPDTIQFDDITLEIDEERRLICKF